MSDNITLPREVVQEAVEALIEARALLYDGRKQDKAATALRTALAAPPVTHPGYVIGSHWLETAYSRICAGEAEADVLRDIGLVRITDGTVETADIDAIVDHQKALRRDAERYRYLRNRDPAEVLSKEGRDAGCWIDCEEKGGIAYKLQLLTGDDADAAIDAAMGDKR